MKKIKFRAALMLVLITVILFVYFKSKPEQPRTTISNRYNELLFFHQLGCDSQKVQISSTKIGVPDSRMSVGPSDYEYQILMVLDDSCKKMIENRLASRSTHADSLKRLPFNLSQLSLNKIEDDDLEKLIDDGSEVTTIPVQQLAENCRLHGNFFFYGRNKMFFRLWTW